MARGGLKIVREQYDLALLKRRYIERFAAVAGVEVELPKYDLKARLAANWRNALQRVARNA